MKPLALMELKSYLKYIVMYVSNVNDLLNSDPLISNTDSVTDDTCEQSSKFMQRM